MVDVNTLQALVPLLRSSGVSRIKMRGLEIEFHGSSVARDECKEQSQPSHSLNETKVDPVESAVATKILNVELDKQLPVDLRTDAVTDFDKILHWSSNGPDEQKTEHPEVPLAGDVPLAEQVN